MTAEAYPLHWPAGVARTKRGRRQRARFSSRRNSRGQERLTLAEARERLLGELDRLRARQCVLSTNLELRLDGLPRSGQRAPEDPGAAVYFTIHGETRCIPCDVWDRVEDNVAAIAKAIEALRGLDRWVNASNVRAAFTGFAALPETLTEDWREVLGVPNGETLDQVKVRYRRMAAEAHPDRPNGSTLQMQRINAAWEAARREMGA